MHNRVIFIGFVVFVSALIAQIWVWDILSLFETERSQSDMSRNSNSTISKTPYENGEHENGQYKNDRYKNDHYKNAHENGYNNNKCCVDCSGARRVTDMNFITGDLARKNVERKIKWITSGKITNLLS